MPSQESDKPEFENPAKPESPAESEKPTDVDELATRVRAVFEGRRRKYTRDDDTARRAQVERDAFTLTALSRQLGVGRESLARLLGGLHLHEGTRRRIERNLRLWLGEGK